MRPLLAALVGVLVAAAPAFADPPGPLSEPIYSEATTEEFRVETKHGSIYGWVRRPVVPEGVKVPVILTYSPYPVTQSRLPGLESSNTTDFFVPRGYARAWVHLVGTGNSGGCYDYGGPREMETAHDVVEWLGTREWSNGRVGMIGASYNGTTQWAAAVTAPKHLATIIPQAAITRWYDYAFQQGVRLFSGSGTPLGFDFGFNQIPVPHTNPDPLAFADNARPCEEIEHNERGFLPDPVYDDFWLARDYLIRAQSIKASVLIEHGWRDYNVHPVNAVQMWHALPATVEKRLNAGQYGHASATFGDSAAIRHAWFDHHLLGRASVLDHLPRVQSEVLDEDVRGSHEWPPRGTETRSYRLGGAPGPSTLAFDGEDTPTWTDSDPQLSEDEVMAGQAPEQSAVFLSDPLPGGTRVAGTPVLDAFVETDAQETFLTPTLFVEQADGTRTFLTRATLNSRNRNSEAKSEVLQPGEKWRGQARFQPVDRLLEQGARIGLAVMSMNTNEVLYPDTSRATNTLDLEASRLNLPLAPAVEAPLPPVAAPAQPIAIPRRKRALARIVSARRAGRTVTLRVRCLATRACHISGTGARGTIRPRRTATLRVRAARRVVLKVRAGRRTARLVRRMR